MFVLFSQRGFVLVEPYQMHARWPYTQGKPEGQRLLQMKAGGINQIAWGNDTADRSS